MGMTLVQGRDFTNDDMSDLARLPGSGAAVPRQGAVIVLAASILVGIALLASYLPIRRVLHADPARALRG